MANIDNKKIFKRQKKESGPEVTKLMVYRAGSLYEAKNEASKIFKLLSKLIFDETDFKVIETAQELTIEDEKFLKKRE